MARKVRINWQGGPSTTRMFDDVDEAIEHAKKYIVLKRGWYVMVEQSSDQAVIKVFNSKGNEQKGHGASLFWNYTRPPVGRRRPRRSTPTPVKARDWAHAHREPAKDSGGVKGFTPYVKSVDIKKAQMAGCFTVFPVWEAPVALDRPSTSGWEVAEKNLLRLVSALLDGVVFENPMVRQDVNGASYVQAHGKILGKYMNADLKKLGY